MAPRQIAPLSSRALIFVAIAGNLLVAATKIGAALWTGSSSMLSEAVHSVVDSGNSILLLHGLRQAERRPDADHPLGYGRELYFWSFVVAVLVFALGAGVSLYEGIAHIQNPVPVKDVTVVYVVICLSAVFDGATWWVSLRSFKGQMRYTELVKAVRDSKDPPSFMLLFEDSASLIGLLIALVGTFLSVWFKLPMLDGVASILIGMVLATVAMLIARETKDLLIGEAADPRIAASILKLANDMDGVAHANGVITVHLAPRQIVVALSLEFADELNTPQIELKVIELERRLRLLYPSVATLFVKPQSSIGFEVASLRRFGRKIASL